MLALIQTVLVALIGAAGPVALFFVQDKKRRKDQTAENSRLIQSNRDAMSEIAKSVSDLAEETSRQGQGMRILLRSSMQRDHQRLVDQGYVTSQQLRDFQEAYDIYHQEGGNGTAARWLEDVNNLPIEDNPGPSAYMRVERMKV